MISDEKLIKELLCSNDRIKIMKAIRHEALKHGIPELATKLQCSRTTLYRTLQSNPKLETIIKLCNALDLVITINNK